MLTALGMVCDGIEGPEHKGIQLLNDVVRNTGKLRYVAVDGNHEWLVEVDWPKDLDWTNGLKAIEAEEQEK